MISQKRRSKPTKQQEGWIKRMSHEGKNWQRYGAGRGKSKIESYARAKAGSLKSFWPRSGLVGQKKNGQTVRILGGSGEQKQGTLWRKGLLGERLLKAV